MRSRKQYKEGNFGQEKKNKGIIKSILAVVFLLLICVGIKIVLAFPSHASAFKYVPAWEKKEDISIVVRDTAVSSQYTPIIKEDMIYFPVDFVKEYIDDTIFWEDNTQKLTITTASKVIRMTTDDLTYYVNNEPLQLDMPVYTIEETAYIPQSTLESLYNVVFSYNSDDKIVLVDFSNESKAIGKVSSNVKLYTLADKKSDVATKVKKGEEVTLYTEEGDFTKIRTASGIPGYIFTDKISDVQTIQAQSEQEEEKTVEPWKPTNGKISMVWDQIFNVEQNQKDSKKLAIDGLNVISPTWFALKDSEGNISNIADKGYVEWAHKNGYQVWGLFSNSFDSQITHDVLSDVNKREKVYKQILALAALYNLDGINIDFESIKEKDGEYYVQFIREITPYLKAQGLTVSVDLYVPSPWTKHYGMEAVGKVVDYVAIMVYDEHWGTSPESGSTSSINWSEEAVANAVEMVDSNKLIMGIPFFTRIWEEKQKEDGAFSVTSSACGMQGGLTNLTENKVTPVYDEQSGQNYGEYEKDGALYKVWLEDETSLKQRMEIMQKYNLAGISGWKRGLEKEGAWQIINEYLKK